MIDKMKINNITEFSHLHNLPVSRVNDLVVSGIAYKSLEGVIAKYATYISRTYNLEVNDHHKHANLYKSRYPNDHLEQVASSMVLKLFVRITELVLYIMSE